MLLMFAVGVGNLGWMLMLGTVMAAEKNLPWGRRLSAPLGVVLLGGGPGPRPARRACADRYGSPHPYGLHGRYPWAPPDVTKSGPEPRFTANK